MSRGSSTGLVARWMPSFVQTSADPPAERDPAAPALFDLSSRVAFFAVAATPRYRASQRRRLQDATRQGMVLVVVAALSNCVWIVPFHPDALALVVGLNTAVGLIAAIGYVWVSTRARRHPEG